MIGVFRRSAGTAPVRFIILGHPRCGSTVVTLALRRHRAVAMFGEIFHEDETAARVGLPRRIATYRHGDDAAAYLRQSIFTRPAAGRAATCGFKLFYEHARATPGARRAWRHLIDDTEVRVIHLSRRNLFDARVSLEIALRTRRWSQRIGMPVPPPVEPFAISPHTCEYYFGQLTAARIWAAEAFAAHPVLALDYDRDIAADFAGTMTRIAGFLGVADPAARPVLQQQRRRPAAQQVTNYAELRDHFEHSLFAGFFSGAADR